MTYEKQHPTKKTDQSLFQNATQNKTDAIMKL